MITLYEVRRTAAQRGIGLETVERDYVLSWVLRGIFESTALSPALTFKGGSALRKVYFCWTVFSPPLPLLRRS